MRGIEAPAVEVEDEQRKKRRAMAAGGKELWIYAASAIELVESEAEWFRQTL